VSEYFRGHLNYNILLEWLILLLQPPEGNKQGSKRKKSITEIKKNDEKFS
jgi:hypothetical protein